MRTKAEIAAYKKQWSERNAERISVRRRKYRAANAKKIADYLRAYAVANAERLRARSKEYYEKNREAQLAAGRERLHRMSSEEKSRAASLRREWRSQNPERRMWSNSKSRAAKRGLAFAISPEDIVIPTHCPILGIELRTGRGPNDSMAHCPTLDRIDSSIGYVPGNVWVISHRANAIKNDGTPDEHERIAFMVRQKLAEKK